MKNTAKIVSFEELGKATGLTIDKLEYHAAEACTKTLRDIISNSPLGKEYDFKEDFIVEVFKDKALVIAKNKDIQKALKKWWKNSTKKSRKAIIKKITKMREEDYEGDIFLEGYYTETGEIAEYLRGEHPYIEIPYCRYTVDFMVKVEEFIVNHKSYGKYTSQPKGE